ncbi:pentapeptide repeat-containing protein [Streptomyces nigra]|uniref:pentapeptide repeat-containing protein n=1 Tax=Streptomyces nigra TaxID=1827580 RepID=UPI003803CD38
MGLLVATACSGSGWSQPACQGSPQVGQAQTELRISEQGQITNRFNAAITNLGSSSIDVRLGGIYALERIMEDSERDAGTVTSVLSAYVRLHAPLSRTAATGTQTASVEHSPAVDIAAVMDVLAAKPGLPGGYSYPVDVRGTDLRGLEAGGGASNFDGAVFSGADLSGASLNFADLTGAQLDDTKLLGADLSNADLAQAGLSKANLSHALLPDANLHNADLAGANLTQANLSGANLTNADFTGAHLKGVKLRGAKLHGAIGLPPSLYS